MPSACGRLGCRRLHYSHPHSSKEGSPFLCRCHHLSYLRSRWIQFELIECKYIYVWEWVGSPPLISEEALFSPSHPHLCLSFPRISFPMQIRVTELGSNSLISLLPQSCKAPLKKFLCSQVFRSCAKTEVDNTITIRLPCANVCKELLTNPVCG